MCVCFLFLSMSLSGQCENEIMPLNDLLANLFLVVFLEVGDFMTIEIIS